MVLIECHGVTMIYQNGVVALSDITLRIDKGEFVFLVGPSGAGKSTFVRLLLRQERPTEGHIYVNGRNLTRLRPRDVPYYRRSIGVVFQDFKLLPNRTARENVAFALRVTEASPRDIRRRVPQVLEMVGLEKKGNCYPAELSGGEQQRVALARAIVNSPSVLLADEPTGNLDPETSWEIMSLLADINRMGATVVVATHAKGIVDRFQRRVIELDHGRLVRDEMSGAYDRRSRSAM